MSANFQNLSPQQLQQLQTQALTTALQAPNEFGTDKLLINVNGQNSKLPTNKNGIVKYTLEQPIKLEVGDKITLVESFVEERGLSIDTISFEEDVEEEIRFLYYIQGDCRNTQGDSSKGSALYSDTVCADQEFTCFPNVFPDFFKPDPDGDNIVANFMDESNVLEQGYLMPNRNYSSLAPSNSDSSVGSVAEKISGANGQYYYMCEYFSPQQGSTDNNEPDQRKWRIRFNNEILSGQPAQACFFRPFYGAVTIKIPAGNYSVSALSDLINNQMNGTSITTNESIDKLTNKLYVEQNTEASTLLSPFFKNLNQVGDYDNSEVTPSQYNPDVDIIGEDTYQPYQRRRGNILTECKFNSSITANRINLDTIRNIPTVDPPVDGGSGEDMPQWSNQYLYGRDINRVIPDDQQPFYDAGVLCGNNVNGETQGFENVSNDFIFRQQANNFFLHLDGFKHIFDDGVYKGVNQYYNKDTDADGEDMKNGKWNMKFFPTLFDIFSMNISTGGLLTFDQNLRNYNFESYPEAEGVIFQDRGYISTFKNPGVEGNSIENMRFQFMFPVRASGDNLDIQTQGELPRPIGSFQQFAGTTSFELKYDTESANRFSILNLHEPYKLANKDPTNQSDTNVGGQQATIFNSALGFFDDPNNPQLRSVAPIINPKIGIYPIDSAGGIAVNNFAFNSVKETKIYKEAIARIQSLNTSNIDYQLAREREIFQLFTRPFDEFFQSESDAKEAWASTFWNRLGFTYEQLGNVSNNLESIYSFSNSGDNVFINRNPVTQPRFIKQMGIITHNAFDYTFIPSTSGLGSGNPYANVQGKTGVPQGYGLRAYTAGAPFQNFKTQQGIIQNYINVLANSYPINAFNFPSLNNGNNYLVIESDIVKTNAKDSNSNSATIVGIMSKENASNDTIFSVNPVTFINTEPRLLSTITVRILNPDGTLVSDEVVGKNNGFIFQLEKAIRVSDLTNQSL